MTTKNPSDCQSTQAEAATEQRPEHLPTKPSRRAKFAWCLAVSLSLAVPLFLVRAQPEDQLDAPGRGLEGSWNVTVFPILPPGAPPISFRAYATYSQGGSLIGSDRTKPFASPQHGSWLHVRGHEYATTLVQDLFDDAGTFLGTFKVRTRLTLITKNHYVGVANVEQRDADGNLELARCARFEGERIVVEPLQAPCEDLQPGM